MICFWPTLPTYLQWISKGGCNASQQQKIGNLVKHTKMMPSSVKHRREGTMCIRNKWFFWKEKKSWNWKKLFQKLTFQWNLFWTIWRNRKDCTKYRLRLCWVNSQVKIKIASMAQEFSCKKFTRVFQKKYQPSLNALSSSNPGYKGDFVQMIGITVVMLCWWC